MLGNLQCVTNLIQVIYEHNLHGNSVLCYTFNRDDRVYDNVIYELPGNKTLFIVLKDLLHYAVCGYFIFSA